MIFDNPAITAVIDDYQARIADERSLFAGMMAGGNKVSRDDLLLPVGPEVGAFLHSLVLAHQPKRILELGTSYGYSTIFLADAAKKVGATVITMELADYKQDYAREKLTAAGLVDVVDFRCGDAVAMIEADDGPFDLVLLDIWKDVYLPCFEAFYPKLSEEAIIAADNMIDPASARDSVRLYRAAVNAKSDLQTTLLPIGQGIELTVKWSAGNPKL
jgi:predicted O-methyltransferase YrrM